ncbi:hypothetical protein BCR44DRAFT_292209 [Catenaria anguillulae PL171]|uniref:Uncharacterized protein n=1 Tax=Catenaria anguillulae PL171 TaxID=765915 RepID=A0A1Y2HV63_9FUNG|nr:hypothetical protein BCR44DRAFT_292209 [Catenaria anguillulae PL171]
MALADLMRIESQRRRLATAVAADHQRKVASKWRAEAQAAKLEAAKLRAALGDVPTSSARDADWKRVQTQLGAVTKALGGTPDPIDASRPVSPTPITLALDQIATRVHHLDAQLRQVREHNVRLLRELDSKDVSVRLLESQVNWLKVNHETVAHQQSQALALQAHTIHSLASGAGAAGSVSVAAGMTPRRPSTSTLTGGGQQMTDAARAAQWEAQGPNRAATATPGRQAQRGGGHSHHVRQASAEYPYHHHGHHEDEYDDDDDHSLSLMAPARRPSAIRSHHDQAADPRVRMPRSTSRQPASQSTPSPNPSRRPPSLPADIHRHPRRSSLDASASRAAAHARHVSSELSLAGSSSVLVSDDEYSSSIATPIRDRQRSAGMDSRYTSVRAAAAVGAASASVPQRAEVPESLRSGRTGREVEVKDRDKDREREREKGGWGWTQSLARKVKKM